MMKNKLKTRYRSCQFHFCYWHVAMLFALLLWLRCGSDKNAGMVEFLCMDQSGAPLEKVEVSVGGKQQQSDNQGMCRFQLAVEPSKLWMVVNASKPGYQFIGPDSVYLKTGEQLTYALHFWDRQAILPPSDPNIPIKVAFNWIAADITEQKITEPPEETVVAHDTETTRVIKEIPSFLLTITSQPTNSRVKIFMKNRLIDQGRTPFNKTFKQGRYTVNVVSDSGYQSKDITVNLTSNKAFDIKHQMLPVPIKIETEPAGAIVYLNGNREPGLTPLEITLREAGFHELEIQRTGFETSKKKIEVQAGAKDTTLSVPLKGSPHNFTIQLKEKGKVFIDSKLINTQWQDRIAAKGITAGYHKVEILYQKGNRKEIHEKYFITGVSGQVYDF